MSKQSDFFVWLWILYIEFNNIINILSVSAVYLYLK
jgi:hypothetical protein